MDVQHRDYFEKEIEDIVSNAEDIGYRDLFRDIEAHTGDAVHYRAVIGQALEDESYFVFLLAINSSFNQLAYGSWTGDRFLKGDTVEIWAEVLGTETYRTGAGSESTVPALSIADIRLLEETTSA